MKKDIEQTEDIKFLVDTFYQEVLQNDRISFFFTEHMQISLSAHMPTMYSFWETMILDQRSYQGNPMLKHLKLNQKAPLKAEHFDIWLELWETTVFKHFEGPKAELAVTKAHSIRKLMEFKIKNQNNDQGFRLI